MGYILLGSYKSDGPLLIYHGLFILGFELFTVGYLMILRLLQQKIFFPTRTKVAAVRLYLRVYSSHHYRFHQFRTFNSHSENDSFDFFDCLLQDCIVGSKEGLNLERPVKQIHAQLILGSCFSAFLSARLVSAYAKVSLLSDAHRVFEASRKDCFSSSLLWNSLLRAYVSSFRYGHALDVYRRMREVNFHPDGFGFPLIIRACAMWGDIRLCGTAHCHVIRTGLAYNIHVCNELMVMYAEIGWMEVALLVFDRMPHRSCISWNILVSGFGKNYDCDGAFEMLCRMQNDGMEPNLVTWTSLISAFARCGLSDKTWELYGLMRAKGICGAAESVAVVVSVCTEMPTKGEIVHGHVITTGLKKYIFVINALVTMYGRNGYVEKAEYLFSLLESKTIVSWNALISAYAQSGLCDEAFSAFFRLNSLEDGLTVSPNVVSWSAVINGFATSGRHKETLELFRQMQLSTVQANSVTVASVLSVCAELSSLPLGREIHTHCTRMLLDSDTLVINGLINMYMKCGNFSTGHLLFEAMISRHITSWNIMISGYGMHGLGEMALKLFHEMVNNDFVKPDEVTFVAVISACSHSGLIAEGEGIFNRMIQEFHIKPHVEHYACMVDLFSRAGLLQKASMILKSMSMEPNAQVWGALLNSCKMHKNTDVAEETAWRIFDLDSEATGSYMLLSNLYAANGRWDDSAKVRLSARTRGLKKIPGQSWIVVNNKLQSFSAGTALNNLEMEELHLALECLKFHTGMESHKPVGFFLSS